MEFVLLPLAIVLLFYFILLKPMLDTQKKHRGNIANLEIGDEVLTSGGFFAIVLDIETQDEGPPLIILEVAPGVELEATPAAISDVNPRGRPDDDTDDDTAEDDERTADREKDGPPDPAEPARIKAAHAEAAE